MIEDVYPLSPLQEGLYYQWLANPNSSEYFQQTSYKINGELNVDMLEKSYQMLVSRYSILRTFFTQNYGEKVLQVVRKEGVSNFKYIDAINDSTFSVNNYREADRVEGFDLRKGSQMRFSVIKLNDDTYVLIWSNHHILMDGWCISLLIRDFFYIYRCLIQGVNPQFNKVYPFSNYIKWLENIDKEESFSYWQKYLSGYTSLSSLPKKTMQPVHTYRMCETSLLLEGNVRQSIKNLCGELGVTENTFIQTAWGILLSKYNNTNDVLFGSVVSGRPADLEGVEEMVGLFTNMIPLRVYIKDNISIADLLKKVQQESIEGTEYHYTQLAEVQSKSELGRNLFDHILAFENYPVQVMEGSGNAKAKDLTIVSSEEFDQNNYEFTVTVSPGVSTEINFSYNGNLYDEKIIENLKDNLLRVIESLVKKPAATVNEITFLSTSESSLLQESYSGRLRVSTFDKTLLEHITANAEKHPLSTAVVYEGLSLSYKELEEKSNQLAHYLRDTENISTGHGVGVMLDRTEKMIIALLGILKAGGIYVPIDPSYPRNRKEFMVNDSGIKSIITQSDYMFDLDYYQGTVFAIDIQLDTLTTSTLTPKTENQENTPAYMIYTSGSTGQPKGVIVEHGALSNSIQAQQQIIAIKPKDKVLQFFSSSFDVSLFEILISLLSGSSLHLLKEDTKKNTILIEDYIADHQIDVATLPAAYLKLINIEKIQNLKKLITGGEAAPADQLRIVSKYMDYYNAYGPTEASICSTLHRIPKGTQDIPSRIPIGTPISNVEIYITDKDLNLLPLGAIGEICVGGSGLARGYLHNESLTAEKFVPNIITHTGILYKTGDLGRWLADGTLDFQGRKDDQVKIRGYRIELGEVERAIASHGQIEKVVVIAQSRGEGYKELIAYVVSQAKLNVSDIKTTLSSLLPDYMIPGYFVQLEALPLTANGKIDKKHLPDPEGLGLLSGTEYVAPRNEVEEKLVQIWQEILEREKIGVKDNFFELGGHSLKITTLIMRVKKQFEVDLNFKVVFMDPTIEIIAEEINNQKWLTTAVADEEEDEIKI